MKTFDAQQQISSYPLSHAAVQTTRTNQLAQDLNHNQLPNLET